MFVTKIQTHRLHLTALLIFVSAGCQSLTQNQQAWQVPHFMKEQDDQAVEVAETILPPLPSASLYELDPSKPVPKIFSVDAKPVADSALVQTSATLPTAQEKAVKNGPEIVSPQDALKVVEKLVQGTSALQRDMTSSDESASPVDVNLQKAQSITVASASKPSTIQIKPPPINAEPAIEQLPPESLSPGNSATNLADKKVESLTIPKAAICRSIKGRGHFVAMPEAYIQPGSTLLVYWELDGLSRDKISKMAQFSATVELIRSDRESIAASVRESLEKIDAADPSTDFAALKWQLPADLTAGEYTLKITTRDESAKTSAEFDLPVSISAGESEKPAE